MHTYKLTAHRNMRFPEIFFRFQLRLILEGKQWIMFHNVTIFKLLLKPYNTQVRRT